MGNKPAKPCKTVGIVGAQVDKGQPKEGVHKGADQMRSSGLMSTLKSLDLNVTDYGNVCQLHSREAGRILNCLNQRALVQTSLELATKVQKSVAENDLTMVLGGDHSLAYGSIWGHFNAFPNSFVVWVDAHADINTPDVSSSGNTHGMPVAFAVKETSDLIPKVEGFEKMPPIIGAKNLLYIGLRDVDTPELKYIKEYNIRYFTMDDVREIGIEKVMEITVKAIAAQPNCKVHLSFDIDGLDPKYAPSTGTPVPRGLTLEEGKLICRTLAMTGCLRSVDLAEVNPDLGTSEESRTTVASALEILKSCINP